MSVSVRRLVFIVCFLLPACVTISVDENLADYSEEVQRLETVLGDDSLASDALRDLGAIYVRTGHADQAIEFLDLTYRHGNRDPKTLFYRGLAKELLGQTQDALLVYQVYTDVSRLSPYRRLMEGRYVWLTREAAYQDIRGRLAEEATLSDEEIAPEIVAVFPLVYQGSDDRYAPLGRGFAEMLSVDLQNVNRLHVVERVRLKVVMDELAFAGSEYVDPTTAPRIGRLLRAGRIVGGSFNLLSNDDLRLDASLVETATAERQDLPSESDALSNFFRVEKRVVFDLIDAAGIELTEAERTQIEAVPTQNLQAFLAYSRGLVLEDEGNYEGAATYYQTATGLDPSFTAADASGQRANGTASAGGSQAKVLASAVEIEPFLGKEIDILDNRLDHLEESVGSPLVPGVESRKPAAEAASSVTESLPDPPPPPSGGN